MSSKKGAKRTKRGPKTPEGRLAVRFNASTHGILSPQPIVNAYEKPEDWERHRAAIVDSLDPEGGMEEVLAERVALMSWRLNRVVLYEAERLQEGQEDVIEDLRSERLHRGRIEAIYKGQDPDALGVLMDAHPANVLDDLEMARALVQARLPPLRRVQGRRPRRGGLRRLRPGPGRKGSGQDGRLSRWGR